MSKPQSSTLVSNKTIPAFYHILTRYEAGLVLTGPEVKSIRNKEINLKGSYISIHANEAYLKNAHISPYKQAVNQPHDPTRDRKLLLNKHEISQLQETIQEKGISIHPLNLHLKHGKIKLEIATCKSKKLHDRRQSLKEKSQQKEINQALKKY